MMDGALTKLQMDQQIALGIILIVCGLVRIILDWLAGLIRRWPFFSAVFFCCSAVDRCGCCCGATSSRRLSLSLGFCCLLLPGGWHFLSAGELEKGTLAGLPSVPLLKNSQQANAILYYARCYAAGARAADRVAAADWYWLTLMRLGKTAAAARLLDEVSPDWDYEENEFYFRRLMVYKGLRDVEETLTYARGCESFAFCAYAYGIACYLWLALGRKDQARAVMEEIAAVPISQGQWATFAYQAAQASLKSDF